jgi:hypothetical protein
MSGSQDLCRKEGGGEQCENDVVPYPAPWVAWRFLGALRAFHHALEHKDLLDVPNSSARDLLEHTHLLRAVIRRTSPEH